MVLPLVQIYFFSRITLNRGEHIVLTQKKIDLTIDEGMGWLDSSRGSKDMKYLGRC